MYTTQRRTLKETCTWQHRQSTAHNSDVMLHTVTVCNMTWVYRRCECPVSAVSRAVSLYTQQRVIVCRPGQWQRSISLYQHVTRPTRRRLRPASRCSWLNSYIWRRYAVCCQTLKSWHRLAKVTMQYYHFSYIVMVRQGWIVYRGDHSAADLVTPSHIEVLKTRQPTWRISD